MKRVTVRRLGDCAAFVKGIVIEDETEVKDISDLRRLIGSALDTDLLEGEAVWVINEQLVELADVRYVQDGDQLLVGGRAEAAMEKPRVGGHPPSNKSVSDRWLRLNVGGSVFLTSRSTVEMRVPGSMLARMFSAETSAAGVAAGARDETGAFLIDRSPKYFEPILDYLRTGMLVIDKDVNPEGNLLYHHHLNPLTPRTYVITSFQVFSRRPVTLESKNSCRSWSPCAPPRAAGKTASPSPAGTSSTPLPARPGTESCGSRVSI
jgi:hypothetical protein